jgi:hypothetical protein
MGSNTMPKSWKRAGKGLLPLCATLVLLGGILVPTRAAPPGTTSASKANATASATTDPGLEAAKRGDYSSAAQIWQKACDGGDAVGCVRLGLAYYLGKGAVQDYNKA